MNRPAVDFSDIQGIVRFGYGPLTDASFFLMKIRDAKAACAWLATAPVSTAVSARQRQTRLSRWLSPSTG